MTDKSDIDLKTVFEQNYLDGDKVQPGQMIASTEVLEFINDFVLPALAAQDRSSRISELESLTRIYTGLVSAAVIRDLADRIEHLKHQADSEKENT